MKAMSDKEDVFEFRSYFKLLFVAPNSSIDENTNFQSKPPIFSTPPLTMRCYDATLVSAWKTPIFNTPPLVHGVMMHP